LLSDSNTNLDSKMKFIVKTPKNKNGHTQDKSKNKIMTDLHHKSENNTN